jgi:small-conductance mechanosensitive channel
MSFGLLGVTLAAQSNDVRVFGVHLIGLTAATARKLGLTVALIVIVVLVRLATRALLRPGQSEEQTARWHFWVCQGLALLTAAVLILGVVSIWFDTPKQLTGALGLVAAGVAIALQRVITAFAAYLIILRGRVFTVGDRIVMAGVRGDVIALGFMQTTVMEMGQPPPAQSDPPGKWVNARQYTGRIVRVTNDRIFDSPVYNYTREFPYLWDEIHIPIAYNADRARAEQILLESTRRHTKRIEELGAPARADLLRRYALKASTELEPRVYWRLTDNWLELTVRFVAEETGVRGLKDQISRDILAAFDEAGLGFASSTYEIVGLPPVRVVTDGSTADRT